MIDSRRPHILYLIDILWGLGGAENAVLRAARLLPPDRYRCSVGTFRLHRGLPLLDGFPRPVVEFPLNGAFNLQALRTARQLRDFIRSEKVDIVHTFFQTADLWGAPVAKLSGCPIAISSRRDLGILRSRKHRIGYRLLNPLFDHVDTVSDAVRDYCIRVDGIPPRKVVTIPTGIEVERIGAANGADELRASLGLDGAGPVILTVANPRPVKGIDVLIRTVARVARVYPGVRLLIAGAVHGRAYGDELQRLAERLGVSGHIRFLGESDRVWALLKLCDVFCLLSRSEGMSNALLEAMASERACVATNVGGNGEVIENGRSGYLVPSDDPKAAAERILGLLADPGLARAMGSEARRRVEQKFSAERYIRELAGMYDRLLAARGLSTGESKAVPMPAETAV
jgi:glycosyltransferase involved in cell wall biosynthesis